MVAFFKGRNPSFTVFYLLVSLAGYLALALWLPKLDLAGHWHEYLIFLLLTIIADLVNVTLPRGGASVSVSTPITFTSIVILGPFAAAWVDAVSAVVVQGMISRRPVVKILFNIPVLALATGLAGLVYRAPVFGSMPDSLTGPFFLVPLAACGIVHFVINTGMVSAIIGFSDGRSPLRVWRANYFWNIRHLLAFVPTTAIIVLLYSFTDEWTLVLFIIPLLLARHAYRLYLEMKETHVSTLTALASALDAKDPYTHGHSYRVSRYALMVGRGMGLSDSDLELLEYGALLHDIGKIGVRGDIIAKPSRLNEEEYNAMKEHPAIGARILERLKFLNQAAEVVKYHHERPDGLGYPDGLRGEQIPYMARILHVCDTFDAMTSSRPYRPALSAEESIEELKNYRGTQFDAEVADIFIGLHLRGELDVIRDDLPVEIYDALTDIGD